MASSLIRGLIAGGLKPGKISTSDLEPGKLRQLAAECGIQTADSATVAAQADILVLAVKPQAMQAACEQIANVLPRRPALVVSIAAGITLGHLRAWLGASVPLVRCMPNTPALVGKGATALYAADTVTPAQKTLAEAVLAAVGLTVWLESEQQIDAVTALSGSGPAYFFLLMECMQDAAQELGLSREIARQLVYQTALGAAALAQSSSVDSAEFRRQVTSPGGTTERAIAEFEAGGFRTLVNKALLAASNRSRELADELGN